mgnify:CR=1 FL=1
MPTYAETLLASAKRSAAARRLQSETQKRRIEMGYVPGGRVHPNGSISLRGPKGIQNYHDTPTLKRLVLERMNRMKETGMEPCCHINGRHQLQIRGKDLRRLKKAIPGLTQQGRKLVIINPTD